MAESNNNESKKETGELRDLTLSKLKQLFRPTESFKGRNCVIYWVDGEELRGENHNA